MSSGEGKLVCVTGGSGYIASWLVKLLLVRGYTVNATLRSLNLTEEGAFDAAIRDCVGVFHTASPCLLNCNYPQTELIDPAIKGAINVVKSCAKFPSVKRVVLTSSIAAMVINGKPINPDTQVDESWWSDPQLCIKQEKWYAATKILAEEAAWNFAKEKGIDLITICPGWTLGPLLQPTLNLSSAVIFNLIGGKAYPNGAYGWVNVKDVANAHIQAFEIQSANGRYCLVERDIHFSDIVKMLQQSYPNYQLCEQASELTETAPEKPYFPSCKYSQEKMKSLGINYTPFQISLKETMESFKEKQFIGF